MPGFLTSAGTTTDYLTIEKNPQRGLTQDGAQFFARYAVLLMTQFCALLAHYAF